MLLTQPGIPSKSGCDICRLLLNTLTQGIQCQQSVMGESSISFNVTESSQGFVFLSENQSWPQRASLKQHNLGWYNRNLLGKAWRRQWHPTPVLLPGKSHGRMSLVGSSPWGRWESDTTERLHFHFSLSCIGEGNGNPLQYPCLENPRDRGA